MKMRCGIKCEVGDHRQTEIALFLSRSLQLFLSYSPIVNRFIGLNQVFEQLGDQCRIDQVEILTCFANKLFVCFLSLFSDDIASRLVLFMVITDVMTDVLGPSAQWILIKAHSFGGQRKAFSK